MYREAPQLLIDVPTLDDAEGIAGLRTLYHQEVLRAGGGFFHPGEAEALKQAELQFVERRLRQPQAFMRVVRAGERCVGFLNAELLRPKQQDAYLGFLVVAPAYRKQGLGTRLIHNLETALPLHHPIVVEAVGADQEALLRFYKRLGFEPCNEGEQFEGHRMIKNRSGRV